MIKNTVVIILVVLLFIIAFILVQTLAFIRPLPVIDAVELDAVDAEKVSQNLAAAIRCQTIASDRGTPNTEAFLELHRQLERRYPRVHAQLQRENINHLSLLYTWQGRNPQLEAVLLSGHLDVVPVDPASRAEWQQPPSSGEITDGFVWGRGSLDNKNQVVAVLEAVENLLDAGFQPERSVYLAFGHDEETGGQHGASRIVDTLKERGLHLAAVLDEGGAVVLGTLPGVSLPVALVGTSEKGYLTLELTVESKPGHSAMPPRQTAIGILAQGLANLEAERMPARLTFVRSLFHAIGPAAPFFTQLAIANTWLFGGLIKRMLSASPKTDVIIRTSTAITMISGGIKDNVLPSEVKAVVNYRLLPGDTIANVCQRVRDIIDDERVRFAPRPDFAWEAAPESPDDSAAFQTIALNIRRVFGGIPVAPYVVYGATDARHYAQICEQVYRFTPYQLDGQDLDRVHGVNERISIDNLTAMIQFYRLLLRDWATDSGAV